MQFMTNIKYAFIGRSFVLLVALCLNVSCDEDKFLETPANGRQVLSEFFQTEDDALSYLTATYSGLRAYNNHDVYDWMIGDMVSDDAVQGRSDEFAFIFSASRFTLNGSQGPLNGRWNENFAGIYRANTILKRVPEMDLNNESPAGYVLKDRIVAEATFLRGYYYFLLLKWFGGVPLITEPQDDPDKYIVPRASVEEIWGQIEKDMIAAAENLPHKGEYSANDIGRIEWGAAKTYAAKGLYLAKKMD